MIDMGVIYDPNALEETDERLFPYSKNRSRRIHKKLVKRFGGEFRKKPCIWRYGDKIVAHPSFRATIEATFKKAAERIVIDQRNHVAGLFGPGSLYDYTGT